MFISMLAIGYGRYLSKHAWQRILHFMVTHFRPDSDNGSVRNSATLVQSDRGLTSLVWFKGIVV